MGEFTYTRRQKKEIRNNNEFWLRFSAIITLMILWGGLIFFKDYKYLKMILWFSYSSFSFSFLLYILIKKEIFERENKILVGMEEMYHRIKNLEEQVEK